MRRLISVVSGALIICFPILLSAQNLELEYSTYLGGSLADRGYDITVDRDLCAYIAGKTESLDFPTHNPYQSFSASGLTYEGDAFVSKLSSSGSLLIYSTYLGGGEGRDRAESIAVDSDDCAYIAGYTASSDFPTCNPYQASGNSGAQAFVSKLSSSGSTFVFSTYLGGSAGSSGQGIAIDSDRCAYVTGYAHGGDFPLKDPYQSSLGGYWDAFVTKFSSSGTTLLYSTFLGGKARDEANDIALDSMNCFYITGYTQSTDLPVCNAYQSSFAEGTSDAFISKFSSSGSTLIFSSYLGGSDEDNCTGFSGAGNIIVDSNCCAYITGFTYSLDFPTVNPYQSSYAGGWDPGYNMGDVFVTKFTSPGDSLVYSTYLGGSGHDRSYGICVDSASCAYVTGYAASHDFPTWNPYQSCSAGQWDIFISRFTSSGSFLVFSTYLGGDDVDVGKGITLDSADNIYINGYTESHDFPTLNPYQSSYAGGSGLDDGDVIACKFRWATPPMPTSTPTPIQTRTPTPSATPTSTPSTTPTPTLTTTPTPPPSITPPPTATLTPPPPSRSLPWITDYDGDGTSDIAVFRAGSGLWAIRGMTRVYFGGLSDDIAPGDYDGDGTTDIGIFRASSGLWAIRDVTRVYFGGGGDLPESGDYDGDGTRDIGVFREDSGLWAVRGVTRVYFGSSGDRPVPGYYTGNGSRQIALFRGSSGLWALRGSSRMYFGGSSDETVPGDYNGDGTWEVGIFRPSSGLWAIRGVTRGYFGSSSDDPLPADYSGAGIDNIGIFRPSSGLWAVNGVTRVYFGGTNDIPVTR